MSNFMDNAKERIGDFVDKVKDKLDGDDETTDAGDSDLTSDANATDPGSVSDVAAATSSGAADTVRESSSFSAAPEPDGTDDHRTDAPGAGRSTTSDIVEP